MPEAGKLEKLRYIKVSWIIKEEASIESKTIYMMISRNLRSIYGLKGSVEAGLYLVDTLENEKSIIIRCSHNHVNKLLGAVALCSEYNKMKLLVYSKSMSGTIKGIRQ